MNRTGILALIFFAVILQVLPFYYSAGSKRMQRAFPDRSPPVMAAAWAADEEQQPDIQWFKDQLKISPKYVEKNEGILGMSWLHFFTMIFLVVFFLGAMVAVYLRNRRTREILASLLREEKDESQG